MRIADGDSLRTIFSGVDFPNRSTFFKWLSSQPEFSDQYARAREASPINPTSLRERNTDLGEVISRGKADLIPVITRGAPI